MVEILPAILETTFEGVEQKLARIENVCARVQIDLMDGIFVPNESWHDADEFKTLETNLLVDLHLMVDKPEQWIAEWSHDSVERFTFHYEATYDARRCAELIRAAGKEVGVALNPETPIERVFDILDAVDVVLLLGVDPGRQGQVFHPDTPDRVRRLREANPSLRIAVDGGITPLVAPLLIAAGVDILVSGSYLFSELDIKGAIENLRSSV